MVFMSDYQQTGFQFSHQNNGLFADYYLNEIVPTLPEWNDDLFNAGKRAFEQIRLLRERLQPDTLDEAHL